jgi:glycosyltransferase involved in cell wall biosynthesis
MSQLAPVSVVMPVRNWHNSIFLPLKSILDSTLDPQEVILIDDGSSDDVAEWLACRINQGKPWIQVICLRTNGVGAGEARKVGILTATNIWIAFLDSDDYWPPDYLMQRMNLAKEGRVFICGPYHYKKEAGEIIAAVRLRRDMVSKWRMLVSNPIANSSVLCSRSIILDSGGYSNLYARNDYATWLRIAWTYKQLIHYDSQGPVVFVTRRADSLSSNKARMLIYNFKAFREAGFSRGSAAGLALLNVVHFLVRYLQNKSRSMRDWTVRNSSG